MMSCRSLVVAALAALAGAAAPADAKLRNGLATDRAAESCAHAKAFGVTKSQVLWIDPDEIGKGVEPFQAWCDQDTDGGGWLLISKNDMRDALDRTDDGYNVDALRSVGDGVAILPRATIDAVAGDLMNAVFRLEFTGGWSKSRGDTFYWTGANYYTTDTHKTRYARPTLEAKLGWEDKWSHHSTAEFHPKHGLCIGLNKLAGTGAGNEHICLGRWCCAECTSETKCGAKCTDKSCGGFWANGGRWGSNPGVLASGRAWVKTLKLDPTVIAEAKAAHAEELAKQKKQQTAAAAREQADRTNAAEAKKLKAEEGAKAERAKRDAAAAVAAKNASEDVKKREIAQKAISEAQTKEEKQKIAARLEKEQAEQTHKDTEAAAARHDAQIKADAERVAEELANKIEADANEAAATAPTPELTGNDVPAARESTEESTAAQAEASAAEMSAAEASAAEASAAEASAAEASAAEESSGEESSEASAPKKQCGMCDVATALIKKQMDEEDCECAARNRMALLTQQALERLRNKAASASAKAVKRRAAPAKASPPNLTWSGSTNASPQRYLTVPLD